MNTDKINELGKKLTDKFWPTIQPLMATLNKAVKDISDASSGAYDKVKVLTTKASKTVASLYNISKIMLVSAITLIIAGFTLAPLVSAIIGVVIGILAFLCFKYLGRLDLVKIASTIAATLLVVGIGAFPASFSISLGTLLATLSFFFYYKIVDILSALLKELSELPLAGGVIEGFNNLLKSISRTLLTIAFVTVCVGALTMLLDAGEFSYHWLLIIILVALSLVIYNEYFPATDGWRTVMLFCVMLAFGANVIIYIFPEPINDAISWIRGDVKEVTLPKGCQLYHKDGDEYVKLEKLTEQTVAKVVKYDKSKKDKEEMYEVILPTDGEYNGGRHVYVSRRKTENYVSVEKEETRQVNYQPETPKLPKIQRKLIEFNGVDSINTELVSMKNAKVSFKGLTVPIAVLGPDGKEKVTIPTGDQDKMGMKDNDLLTLYTNGQSGKVELEITLDYYKATDYYKTLQQ